jgi:hypothetical protein
MLLLLAGCGGVSVREVPPNDPPQQQAQVEPQQQQAQQTQQPVCPQGSTWNGSACVGTVDTSCPAGTTFVENRGCVAVRAGVQTSPPPPPPPPGTVCPPGTAWGGSSCMVTKAEWVKRMDSLLPGKICALPLFQRCFRASLNECERIVASLSDACMGERNLPPLFDDARGQREGEAVGRCIGEAYQQNMKARGRAVASAECQ